jgi:CubicO group peptidase (beta-lactamase class C family)
VQDLLRHTAGLTYEFLGNSAAQKAYRASKVGMGMSYVTNAEFSKLLAEQPLQYEPATMWEYSRATDVLGVLIEAISGQTLGNFLTEHIFKPLKMFETSFNVPVDKHHRIAEPFKKDPDGGIQLKLSNLREDTLFESGGGGLASTAHDYARFLQFMLNKGELDGVRLLGSHTVDYMTADHLGNIPTSPACSVTLLPAGHGFGLGFAVRKETGISTVPGSAGVYYWGGIAGTTFFVDPKLDMFAMLLIQAPNQRDYYRPLFRNLVYAALEA